MKKRFVCKVIPKMFLTKHFLSLFLINVFVIIGISAQELSVNGVVTDGNSRDLLPGVSVTLKSDPKVGVTTNLNGAYNIKLSNPQSAVLIFSYLGYESQEIAVGNKRKIDVVLTNKSTDLDEVVVTALDIKRDKRALGYATSTIQGGDMVKAGVTTNPLSALYGKAAGVGVQATSGGPMGGVYIKVRGAQGLESTSGTRPLFVVDGVPMYDSESSMTSRGYDPLNSFDYGSAVGDINSEDIESIEILKSAKASVLYGSKGANGVVLITTKRGAGTRGLGVQLTFGLETEVPFTFIDFQNEYGTGTNEYSMSYDPKDPSIRRVVDDRYSFGPKFDGSMIKFFDGTMRPYEAQDNNYLDMFKNGSASSFTAALSGGNDKGNMRLAFSNYDYNGTMMNQGMVKNTLSFNGTMQASKFANFEFIQNLYSVKSRNRRPNLQHMVAWGTFNRDYDINSAIDSYKDENGYMHTMEKLGNLEDNNTSWGWPDAFTGGTGFFQMLWNNNENRNLDARLNSVTSIKGNFKFLPYLTLRLQAGLNHTETEFIKKNKVMRKNEETGKYEGGRFSYSREKNKIQQYDAFLFFDKSFMDKNLGVFAFANGSYQRIDYTSVGVGTYGNFKFPDFWSLTNGDAWPSNYDSGISSYGNEGEAIYRASAQVTVDWKKTYYLEFQATNDWASTLPKQNRSYFYPGASFTWNFSETFEIPKVTFGKFRLSWADVGRPASRYYALKTYSMNTLPAPQTNINDVSGPSDLFAGDLMPERKREWETGFNLRLFKDPSSGSRLEMDFSYYNNTFYNQIMSVPLSAATGARNIRINAGKTRNEGIELFLKGTPISTPKFMWQLSGTLARQWDKIHRLYPGITELRTSTNGVYRIDREGEPMGSIWMYDYVKDDKGNRVVSSEGVYQVSTDADDLICVGSINPDILGGFNSNFYFKGDWGVIDLMMGFDYRYGGKVLSYSNFYLKGNGLTNETLKYRDTAHGGLTWTEKLSDGTTRERHDALILPGVKADGTPNDIMITAHSYYTTFIHDMSSGWQPDVMQDNNYIKFREMALSYTLPKKISNSMRLEKLTVSLTARNLCYLYKSIDNIDAEAVLGTSVRDNWLENSNYPSSRMFGFRVNVNF